MPGLGIIALHWSVYVVVGDSTEGTERRFCQMKYGHFEHRFKEEIFSHGASTESSKEPKKGLPGETAGTLRETFYFFYFL